MPAYDYRCMGCRHEWEDNHDVDLYKRKCPKCKELKAKRLIGKGTGIIFKGAGFYENDYKKPDDLDP